MDKISDKYTWFRIGNVARSCMNLNTAEQFDSISVKGDLDVVIRKGDSSKTNISFDEKSNRPVFSVDNGVLTVDAGELSSGFVIDLGAGDRSACLEVYVPEGTNLQNIDIDADYGDVEISDVSADAINIKAASGDVSLDRVSYSEMEIMSEYGDVEGVGLKSGGLRVEAESGDVELQGEFSGITDIKAEYGDTEVDTLLQEELYTLDLYTDYGDIQAGLQRYEDSSRVNQGTGANIIKILNDSGDINISFGN